MIQSLRFLAAGLLVACALSASAADYVIHDLGVLPSGFTVDHATGINGSGNVVGYVTDGGGNSQAFRWSSGGGFDVAPTLGGNTAYGFAINNSGTIVGQSQTGVGFNSQAFRQTQGGSVQGLGSLGGNFSQANGINSAGDIVGSAYNGTANRAFVWKDGVGMVDLGGFTANGGSAANGINDSGEIVGSAVTSGGDTHAFYYDGGFTDLGTLGAGTTSTALAINASGMVVGFGGLNAINSTYGAFSWTSGGGLQALGGLFSYDTRALAVNNSGAAVGWSWIDTMGDSRAVLWNGGVVTNLNSLIDPSSGWLLTSATGINDAGQIVGMGTFNGETHAYVLSLAPTAPGPAAMMPFLAGGLAALRRRRQKA